MFIFLYRCVIKSLCSPNVEFQKVNPTTQIALFSFCVNECPEEKKLIWNIYFGRINSTQNFTKWILFDQMTNFENICSFSKWNSLEIRSYLSIRRNQQFIIWSSITNRKLSWSFRWNSWLFRWNYSIQSFFNYCY